MRIILLIDSLDGGGAETQLVSLAQGLKKNGHDVFVALFYYKGRLINNLIKSEITIISLEKTGRWDIVGFVYRYIKLLQKKKPDVVYGFLGTSNIMNALIKCFFKKMKFVWGIRSSAMDIKKYDWLVQLFYKIESVLSFIPDHIIANSYSGRDSAVQRGFPEKKISVIVNGIDAEQFCPNKKSRKELRKKWGVAENEKLIGHVGRLDPKKDHMTFLEAAAIVKEKNDDAHFVCVGDGPQNYRYYLEDLGKKLGLRDRLIWAGALSDIANVYNALDILVSSSAYGEGFPNVIGEAMACGVYPVVTDVGDSARIVNSLGKIVKPQNKDELAEAVLSSLSEISKADSELIRERIVSNFALRNMVEDTEKKILNIIGQ